MALPGSQVLLKNETNRSQVSAKNNDKETANRNKKEMRYIVSRKIREMRRCLDITQEQLAEWSGTSVDTVKRLEKGHSIHYDTLLLIIKVLRISFKDLEL